MKGQNSLPRHRGRCVPGAGRRRSRGQALVEFALVLPVLLLFFAAALDGGRLFYAQVSLSNMAREGAFEAARTQGDAAAVTQRVQLEARNSGVLDVTPTDIRVTCTAGCAQTLGSRVAVSVDARFNLVTPVLTPFFGGSFQLTLTRTATAQVEVLPQPTVPPAPSAPPPPTPTPEPSETPAPTPPSGTPPPPTPTPAPTPTPTLPPCVHPPKVIDMTPAEADEAITLSGLNPVGYHDLSTGKKGVVQAQNPDWTLCRPPGSDVTYHWRPN
jgi:Flp pilus assembly protein TadG